MAGQKNKVIEFEFRGSTIGLEDALKKVSSLIRGAAKAAEDTEDAKQAHILKTELETLQNYRKILKSATKSFDANDKDAVKKVQATGNQYLKLAERVKTQVIGIKQKQAQQTAAAEKAALQKQQAEQAAALKSQEKAAKEAARVKAQAEKEAAKEKAKADKEALAQAKQTAKEEAAAEKAKLKAEQEAAKERERIVQMTSMQNLTVSAAKLKYIDNPLLESYKTQLSALPQGQEYIAYMNDLISRFNAQYEQFRKGEIAADDFAKTVEELSEAHSQARSIVSNLTATLKAQSKSVNSWSSVITGALQNAKKYFTDVNSYISFFKDTLSKTFKVVKESVELYSDYAESVNLIRVVTRDATQDLEDFATALSIKYGYSRKTMNDVVSEYYSFAEALGMTANQATILSTKMTMLALDWASLMNFTNEEASSKLQGALAGRTQAMNFYGAVVSDANVEEWLLTKGIKRNFKALNESSQAYARFAYLVETLNKSEGDLENTITSSANQLRILSDQVTELKTNVGTLFTKVLLPGLRAANGILTPINSFLKGLNSTTDDTTSATNSATDAIKDETSAYKELATVGTTSLDEINQATGSSATSSVDSDIEALYDELTSLEVDSGLYEAGQALGSWFNELPTWLQYLIELNVAFTGLVAVIGIAMAAFNLLGSIATKSLAKVVAQTVKQTMATEAQTGAKAAETTATAAESTAEGVNAAAKESTTVATENEEAAVVTDAGAKATDAGVNVVDATTEKVVDKSKEGVAGAAIGEKGAIATEQPTKATDVASNVAEASTGVAAGAGKVAAAGIGAPMVAALIMSGLGMIAGISGLIISLKNKTSQGVNSNTPALAKGGVVDTATLALIGEGNYSEAVVPLGNSPQFVSMKEDIAQSVTQKITQTPYVPQRSRGSETPIILQLNGRELARAILPDLGITRPQTGVKLT